VPPSSSFVFDEYSPVVLFGLLAGMQVKAFLLFLIFRSVILFISCWISSTPKLETILLFLRFSTPSPFSFQGYYHIGHIQTFNSFILKFNQQQW